MTYRITIQHAGVPWWRRLLRRHWRVVVEKSSTTLVSGTTGDIRMAVRADRFIDLTPPRILYEPVYHSVPGDRLETAVVLIEESELYQ